MTLSYLLLCTPKMVKEFVEKNMVILQSLDMLKLLKIVPIITLQKVDAVTAETQVFQYFKTLPNCSIEENTLI